MKKILFIALFCIPTLLIFAKDIADVQYNMTINQVDAILGKPINTIQNANSTTYRIYQPKYFSTLYYVHFADSKAIEKGITNYTNTNLTPIAFSEQPSTNTISTITINSDPRDYDIIVTTDQQQIEGVIEEISEQNIKYRQTDFRDGPLYVLSIEKISSIVYRNGKVQIFNQAQSQKVDQSGNNKKSFFQCMIEFSGCFTRTTIDNISVKNSSKETTGGPNGDVVLGCKINPYVFCGGGWGIHSNIYNGDITYQSIKFHCEATSVVMPLYADVRAFLPLSSRISPYIETSLGGYIGLSAEAKISGKGESIKGNAYPDNGLFFQLGAGCDIQHCVLGIGYRMYYYTQAEIGNFGFVKLGVRLGKNPAKK